MVLALVTCHTRLRALKASSGAGARDFIRSTVTLRIDGNAVGKYSTSHSHTIHAGLMYTTNPRNPTGTTHAQGVYQAPLEKRLSRTRGVTNRSRGTHNTNSRWMPGTCDTATRQTALGPVLTSWRQGRCARRSVIFGSTVRTPRGSSCSPPSASVTESQVGGGCVDHYDVGAIVISEACRSQRGWAGSWRSLGGDNHQNIEIFERHLCVAEAVALRWARVV